MAVSGLNHTAFDLATLRSDGHPPPRKTRFPAAGPALPDGLRQPPRSCHCTKPRWIFAVGLAATFPGLGAGDGLLGHRADRKNGVPSPHRRKQRRGHRYFACPSIRGHPIDYLDPRFVNYRVHTHKDDDAAIAARKIQIRLTVPWTSASPGGDPGFLPLRAELAAS